MIAIEHLEKRYGDFSLKLSMQVPAGRVTGLIGRNGAGKTTTLKAILGLIRPDAGSVKVFGKDAKELAPGDKEQIGAALSDAGFSQLLNAQDIARILGNMYHAFDAAAFGACCAAQGLPMDKPLKEFSTGMRAKLRVLTAMSHGAKLLILDEPTAGLDVVARGEVLDLLRAYLAEDEERSVLISSHISSDLEGLCDDIYMLREGEVVLHEDTDRILDSYGILKVSEDAYGKLDRQYLLAEKREDFGYTCLTDEKQYYLDNYPKLVVENAAIDSVIVLMLGGN